ncbi:hypothetical protein JB92DRAFT_3102629 [Gautieria morchelliformis]|nr:hypothetical protein JB92DRAFT_3102629 [Gautieria morchelliformis]
MDCNGFSGAMLDWKCPNRACGSNIPLDVYHEIFTLLRPAADPDTGRKLYNTTLARLAPVCRYFAYYATHEMWRCLEFDGSTYQTSRMPAKAWCMGVHTQLQPLETLRTQVRECTLRDWLTPRQTARGQMALKQTERRCFATQVIPMLSRLDNLAVLMLDGVPMSRALLQSIGRLRGLEELTLFGIGGIGVGKFAAARTREPVFAPQETPFPSLRRLALHCIDYRLHKVLQDALRILAGAPSLRTIVVEDSEWLDQLLPLITPQLVSFCGDLGRVTTEAFLRFIKAHAALQSLTVYFTDTWYSYIGIELDPADLPELRSFSGPFALARKVIGSRPVTKLASPRYMPLDSKPLTLLPFMGESNIFHVSNSRMYSWDEVHDEPEVWRALKPICGGISQLFVRVSDASEVIMSQIGLCFPNIVHLQLGVPHVDGNDLSHSWNVGQALLHFKSLKSLALCSEFHGHAACWISAGEQHHFVHDVYQGSCPTLKTVLFGPLMVWHLHALPMRAGECHCELELLSPRTIRTRLQRLGTGRQVCDWRGTLVRLLREGPSGLSELETEEIIKPGPDP